MPLKPIAILAWLMLYGLLALLPMGLALGIERPPPRGLLVEIGAMLGLQYESWRTIHAVLALFVVAGGLGHALMAAHHTGGGRHAVGGERRHRHPVAAASAVSAATLAAGHK